MAAKVRLDDKGIYWVVAHHNGRRRKKPGSPRIKAETVLVSSRYLNARALRSGISAPGWPVPRQNP